MQNELPDLSKIGVLIENSHIIYTSGKHGSSYINKDALYPHPNLISQLCLQLAQRFEMANVEVVAAPVIGGVILSQWVAWHLSELTGRPVMAVYAEKDGHGGFAFKRGYDRLVTGKNVLIVEDVLNTGGSIAALVEALRPFLGQGRIVGLAALANRGGVGPGQVGGITPIVSLWNLKLEAFDPGACPLCKAGIPINASVGKGSALNK